MRGLASALVAAVMGLSASGAAAIVVNGSFEDTDHGFLSLVNSPRTQASLVGKSGDASWGVFPALPGWQVVSGAGIELQTLNTVGGASFAPKQGDFYVELDSHPNNGASNTTIRQNLGFLQGGVYEFSFWYAPRTNDVGSNGIEYSIFNGISLINSVTGSGNDALVWRQIVETFVVPAGGLSPVFLQFAAIGKQDTLGGFIDDISLTRVAPVPLPAAGWMLLAGLGALCAARRRPAA
jgi:hypothetical protein